MWEPLATCEVGHFNHIKFKIQWLISLATFQAPSGHRWLVATMLDRADVKYFPHCRSPIGQCCFPVLWGAVLWCPPYGLPPAPHWFCPTTQDMLHQGWGASCLSPHSGHLHRKPLRMEKFTGVIGKENVWAAAFLARWPESQSQAQPV